jgi:hypothetical protein
MINWGKVAALLYYCVIVFTALIAVYKRNGVSGWPEGGQKSDFWDPGSLFGQKVYFGSQTRLRGPFLDKKVVTWVKIGILSYGVSCPGGPGGSGPRSNGK